MSDDWAQQLAEELHKPITRKFTKRRVFVKGVDEIWAADLVELQRFSDWNKGINYLLMVIDVFSKFGWIEPLKNKKGETVANAFEKIFKSGRQPRLLWVDKGKEFYNKNVNQLLSRKNIKLYSTENEEKSSVAERFNRTIKQKMWKMFSANNNTIYADKIDELLKNYNSSWHRSVQMSPIAASDITNTHQVFANLYSDEIYKQVKKPKFRIGDRVRISKYKRKLFDKGFTPNWTEEIFVINQILHTKPVTCLVDLQGEAVTGSFYEPELQKTTQEIFRIEKVIRRDNKRKRALVKWRGYPGKFDSWVPMSELNKH